ncbi:MAG: hypothetical protein M9925_00695 [Chloroflexi bacterium]|nr:hypothetical protein [Chloroflexota bacterium]
MPTATATLAAASPEPVTPIPPRVGSGNAQPTEPYRLWFILGGLAAVAGSVAAGVAGWRGR